MAKPRSMGRRGKRTGETLEGAAVLPLFPGTGIEDPSGDLVGAQEMAFEAIEAPNRKKRIALAKAALALSPLCADAYGILAGEAEDREEALLLRRQAAEAGKRALSQEVLENVGFFWLDIETRPYMRALHGLGLALWDNGRQDEAVAQYRELLRLNPNDNQGIRYLLVEALLELRRHAEARALLKRYEEDESAVWTWSAALLAFREKGDGAASRKALKAAVESNPHIPDYLLGRKSLPRGLPALIGMGDKSEAIVYVAHGGGLWEATDGAKAWIESTLAGAAPASPSAPSAAADRRQAGTEQERIDEAVLALLYLGLHDRRRAWKGFDFDAMDRLHEQGMISNPAGAAKSVSFTQEGLERAEALYEALFIKGSDADG